MKTLPIKMRSAEMRKLRDRWTCDSVKASARARRAGLRLRRPRTRGDCIDGPRPCPWVGCQHHLALDVNPRNGSIRLNFPHMALADMAETCLLDFIDNHPGGARLPELAAAFGVSYDRAYHMVVEALRRYRVEVTRRAQALSEAQRGTGGADEGLDDGENTTAARKWRMRAR